MMVDSRTAQVIVLIWIAILLLAACNNSNDGTSAFECEDSLGCVTILPDDPIQIGVLQVQTGEVARIGIEQIRSIEIAVSDRNSKLLGHDIQLIIEDSLCSPAGGEEGATRLLFHEDMVAVLGTSCSGSAVTASRLISDAGWVMISGGNTAPSLTSDGNVKGADWQPGFFRTVNNDHLTGYVAALFAYQELGIRKVATLNDGDTYTTGLTNAFETNFVEFGGEIVLQATVNKGDRDMIPILTAVADSDAELLFFPIFEPEGNFIMLQKDQVEGLELESIRFLSADGLFSSTFIESVGEVSAGMYFVVAATPSGEDNETIVSTYTSTYGEPPFSNYYGFAYDATNLLFDVIAETSVVEDDGTIHIRRSALRDALRNTSEFQGLTGSLSCDEFGDCSGTSFNILQVGDPLDGFDAILENVVFTYTPE